MKLNDSLVMKQRKREVGANLEQSGGGGKRDQEESVSVSGAPNRPQGEPMPESDKWPMHVVCGMCSAQ